MGLSFSFRETPFKSTSERRLVLVTGAAGRIGKYFTTNAPSNYKLRLMIRSGEDPDEELKKYGVVMIGDLADLDRLKVICEGVDTILHLAGDPNPNSSWSNVWKDNVEGTYNLLVAAKAARCRRVIYASSIHAVSGYPSDVQITPHLPINPGDIYGVSKCCGEALGRYFAEQEGLSVIVLRIGAFQPLSTARDPNSLMYMDSFVSERDLCDLIVRSINDLELQFGIFHGVSDNRFKRLDISDAREILGFRPKDDFTAENPKLAPLELGENTRSASVQDPEQESGLRDDL